MEKAFDQHLLDVKHHQLLHQLGEGDIQLFDRSDVINPDAFFKAHHQGMIRAIIGERHRKAHPRISVDLAEMLQVGQLLAHAHLLQDHPGEGLQQRFDGVAGLIGKERPEDLQEQVQQQDIDAHLQLDIFPQQLDGDNRVRVAQLGFVHLADGGTGQRLVVKVDEHFGIGESAAESPQAILVAHRRHAVMQLPKRLQIVRVEEIGPGCQHLGQLEKAGAKRTDILHQRRRGQGTPQQPATPTPKEQEHGHQKAEDRVTALRAAQVQSEPEATNQLSCSALFLTFSGHLWWPD